jgi:excinuclease ABC subunit A
VTGVSGSGKSSLVNDILRERLAGELNGAGNVSPGPHEAVEGLEHLDKVINIDQSPIGRTPRSNPATYIKVFDEIRALFAKLPDSKVRGYKPGRFSFNVKTGSAGGGRCEACEGYGATKMEMDFLADIWTTCPVCEGRRFNHETLQVYYKHKTVADVLSMDVQEALEHFANVPKIARMLRTLHDVGLDYLKLGQSSTTLSGGEAQRIKLARELVKRGTGRTLYILDEPTTGLHFDDIKKLLGVLHGFVDAGNTVVVIEHNLDVVKTADWVIDLGPEGGDEGGHVVVSGTPEDVARCRSSYTGQSLGKVLGRVSRPRVARGPNGRGRTKTCAGRRRGPGNGEARAITVVGARQHNLKNITVEIPRGRTTVCSGVSGSGKSSFALDTVYAEGQRRYVESLSAYARQFLGQLAKPRVDHVYGLSPAISIEQKSASRSPRSTVGTVTEIYDYMRILWSRLGRPYCPRCDVPIGAQSSDEVVDKIMSLSAGSRALILAPIERSGSETFGQLFARQRANGFVRVRIDGVVHSLDADLGIDHRRRHSVELVIDRVVIRANQRSRVTDSVEQALSVGAGVCVVQVLADGGGAGRDLRFSQRRSCDRCGSSYEELSPHHFSFNSRLGWCRSCEGLGTQRGTSLEAIVGQPGRSLNDGAIDWGCDPAANPLLRRMLETLAEHLGFTLDTPWYELSTEAKRAMLHGCGERWIEAPGVGPGFRFQWKGFYPAIDEVTKSSWQHRQRLEHLTSEVECQACAGGRLRADAAAVRLGGKTLLEVCTLPLGQALRFFRTLKLDKWQRQIAGELLHEVESRLRFLVDVGVDYLTLHRSSPTLSGGEAQRIRLASQLGSGLTGVLYVLDEPTIGLHPRDNRRLIAALARLRDLDNTLLMVEHDREVIESADHILDFGPGAGDEGGRVVTCGTPKQVRRRTASLTGAYLAGRRAIEVPTNRRPVVKPIHAGSGRRREAGAGADGRVRWLTVRGATENNLRDIDVGFPLGRFTAVTGVSGSGKSSLVSAVLNNALAKRIHRARVTPGRHAGIDGVEYIDKVINVDQEPIGNSPSSNPATYTGVFDQIRELFARLPDSKVRGYNAKRFSFNRPGGRCESCEGNGHKCVQMHFLPDVWVRCDDCGGARYNRETLEVRYKGRNISDVLNMRISEAAELFANIPRLRRMLQTLLDVGLGYLQLGQAAPTLSGGEAQRVKLAAELGRPSTGKTLYILDEPTTGLHFDDLKKLLNVLHRLVDLGNTVICIEHNMDVIKTADWIIDLGPEAGESGGGIVAEGTCEQVARCRASHTGRILAEVLAAGPHARRAVFDPAEHEAQMLDQSKPLKLDESSEAATLPWKRDGKRWHTRERLDHQGRPTRWDGETLVWICDLIQELGGGRFKPTDWNDRARVEIKAPSSKATWFFHALTANQWLVDLNFRVPRNTFAAAALAEMLDIPTLDEREDLPVYGPWERVAIRRRHSGIDQVRMHVHDRKDLRPTAFRKFLKQAVAAYFRMIDKSSSRAGGAEPWKADGRKWHLSQKSMPPRGPAKWPRQTLVELAGRITKAVPDVELDWGHKIAVKLTLANGASPLGKLVTNSRQGIKVELRCPRGLFTPARVEGLGADPRIVTGRGGCDTLRFMVRRMKDLDAKRLSAVLRECRAALTGES